MNDIVIDILPPEYQGQHENESHESQRDVSEFPDGLVPSFRVIATTPLSPWPWMDFGVDTSEVHPLSPGGLYQDPEWSQYPRSLFGNCTHDQVERQKILKPTHNETCSIHKVVVFQDGTFEKSGVDRTFLVENPRTYWDHLENELHPNIRVQALFVENMTVPVLQILGTKYNVEPSFFASSINRIPSRYQEDSRPDQDHITIVIPFIRVTKNPKPISRAGPIRPSSFPLNPGSPVEELLAYKDKQRGGVDTQAPLFLPGDKILVQDLLSIHMFRKPTTSTIISYNPSSELARTSARRLQYLVQRMDDNVYWSKIFNRSKDPTFLFLAILWYALYSWGEVFEVLYRYVNALESDVLKGTNLKLTQDLDELKAYFLYYHQLLHDFRVSVEFIRDTPNPAMSVLVTAEERHDSSALLHREANNLISEIYRLSVQRVMLSDRLHNAFYLAFVNVLQDNETLKKLSRTMMVDSATTKKIAYLTMIFLPATLLANVFSMNVVEMSPKTTGRLVRYIEVTIGLTAFTSWLLVVLYKESSLHLPNTGIIQRIFWPVLYAYGLISPAFGKREPRISEGQI